MSLSTLGIILIVLAVLALIGWLFRSLIKLVLVVGFVYLFFHIGFIWGYDEVNELFHLDKFLKPEVSENLASTYDTIEQKREEYGVVQTEEIKKVMDETLQKAWEEAGNAYSSIDKEALIQELKEKLDSYSQEEIDQAVEQMDQQLETMTEAESGQ